MFVHSHVLRLPSFLEIVDSKAWSFKLHSAIFFTFRIRNKEVWANHALCDIYLRILYI